jgi:2-(3-amino-3-carboxypropyl)histidine synthase
LPDLDYDFEMKKVLEEIKKNKAEFIGLQFPEGLKKYAVDIAREIEEETDARTVIFIDPVYGACDTKEKDAVRLNLDLVIHFGHTGMKFSQYPSSP